MDTRPRTLLISFCTVQLTLWRLSGPDLGELPGFRGSMVFRHAPIPRKGSGNQQQQRAGLRLNIKKTKAMTTVGLQEFKPKDDHVKIVPNFNFLGSIISDDADCEKEIRRRLAMGRSTMTKLVKIMKDEDISVVTKTKLVYFLVFLVVTYDSESWTLCKADQRRLNAFEMWT